MFRPSAAALAALLLVAGAARAQETNPAEKKKTAPPAPAATAAGQPSAPAAAPAQPAAGELDPATRAAIQREVDKAREQIRDEVRAEIQGAQSAAEFIGAVAEGPKLQFLQIDGYFRVRGDLFNSFDLGLPVDPSGYTLFPRPLNSSKSGSLATANMRFRLEPTLNVSEVVRVRSQLDILDNYVLGSSTGALFDDPFSPYPSTFYGSSRVLTGSDPRQDRAPVLPKRVWGEVQTPVGLLSFGRMPSEWGLGVLTHAGNGIDDDYGDTVDRIQFALPPVQTPIGAITFVPILDFDHEGVLASDQRFGSGVGQPFDLNSNDDARTWALKAIRIDTDDEIRRKLDRGGHSFNFGAYYNYRSQRYTFPAWESSGFAATPTALAAACTLGLDGTSSGACRRSGYGHVFDLWMRYLTPRWRFELEAVGVTGHVGTAATVAPVSPTDPLPSIQAMNVPLLLRQWGGTLVTEFKPIPNKLMLGVDVGIASGDRAPGFGNAPDRLPFDSSGNVTGLPARGSYEGPQYGLNGDHSISNFRFNPGYRIDYILWRNILGQVTDAWYLKPKIRWDIFPGLAFDGGIVYSQAIYGESTPSSSDESPAGKKPLGLELDTGLTYTSGSGFMAFGKFGVLQPLGAFGPDSKRATMLGFGLAAKF
jgi:uncharacterized protein (TIGR04551 family)